MLNLILLSKTSYPLNDYDAIHFNLVRCLEKVTIAIINKFQQSTYSINLIRF